MIDQAFDRIARVIEVMLALAFIFAVLLNFANVVGRYLLGLSLLGADEVQIFIMVAMTFLGAAVVTRRNLHLRMDVLVRFLPAPVRVALRVAEQVLLAALAGFVLTQSYFYARQMWRIGRTSDMAGVPMWIPHGTVALGLRPHPRDRALGPCPHDATIAGTRGQAMTFALAVVPIALLLLGFPIFLVLLTAVTVALVFFMHVPLAALQQTLFASVNAFALLAIPFFIYAGELMGRGSVAQRLVDFVQGGVGSIRGSLGVTAVGTSAIFGAISGASAATVATIGKVMVPAMRRAGYPETFTAGLITAVGAIDVIIPPSIPMIVYGAAAEESVARLYAAGVLPGLMIAAMLAALRGVSGEARELRSGRAVPAQSLPAPRSAAACGRWARRSSSSAASMAACSRRPRPPRSPASTPRSSPPFVFRELRLARHRRGRRHHRAVHRSDSHHRGLRRRVRVAPDREPGPGRDDRVAAVVERIGVDAAAGHQRPAAGWWAASSIRCRRSCCSARCSCRWSRPPASTPSTSASW